MTRRVLPAVLVICASTFQSGAQEIPLEYRVKAAFLSAEDKNFYQHPGIDVTGFARALVAYLTGGPTQGGSTRA